MLDGIGKDVCFAFAIFLSILLGTDDNGLGAVHAVNAVDDLIEAPHLLDLLGIDVEQILLDGAVGINAHDNHEAALTMGIVLLVGVTSRVS